MMVRPAAAIVVAAGRGERMGAAVPKPFLTLGGRPILVHTLQAVEASDLVRSIIVVVGASDTGDAHSLLSRYPLRKAARVVAGGATRQDSVAAGLAMVDDPPVTVVHDGVRPLVSPPVIDAVIRAAAEVGAASAGIPMRETVKVVEGSDATQTADRDRLWIARTPQAFRTELLRAAHQRAQQVGFLASDDAGLVERMGVRVRMVEDTPRNIKVTVPDDLALAEAYLDREAGTAVRTGIGYDAHRLAVGRVLRLGGVEIPSPRGLAGYSDADVLTHAIMDALLGAAGLGDIGQVFPPGDPAYKDADSLILLRQVTEMVAVAGWRVAHVDTVVMAEAPRLAPHIAQMRQRLAQAMSIDPAAVSIKATTTDGMGAIGRGEGIAAQAVATLVKNA